MKLKRRKLVYYDASGKSNEIRWAVVGPSGAVEWHAIVRHCPQAYSDYRHVTRILTRSGCHDFNAWLSPVGVEYHGIAPWRDDMTAFDKCPLLADGPCYCDGSGLAGLDVMDLCYQGCGAMLDEHVMYRELERRYGLKFGEADDGATRGA